MSVAHRDRIRTAWGAPIIAACLLTLVLLGACGTISHTRGGAGSGPPVGGSSSTWAKQATQLDPAKAANDNFGYSVALSVDRGMVGARGTTVAGQREAGVVYVYSRCGSTWMRQTTLRDPAEAAGDWFGFSVALDGQTAFVGANGTTVNGHGLAGVAYVYGRSGSTWVLQTTLRDPANAAGDNFGYSVALSGSNALVGAPATTVNGQGGAGVAYLYSRSGSTWKLQAMLRDPANAAGDYFGSSIALDGDTLIVSESLPKDCTGTMQPALPTLTAISARPGNWRPR